MANTITGIDISKYQGPWDFVKTVEAGYRFAFIRAGGAYQNTGAPFTDYRFVENARKAEEAEIPAGFYWYFVPNGDPILQADYFVNLIKDKKQQLPPVIDLEYAGAMTPAQITDRAGKFITRVEEQAGVWPLVYSRSNWLNENTVESSIWNFCELWIARYIGGVEEPWDPDNPDNMKPPWWSTWRFWQYSNSGSAVACGGLGPPSGDDDVDLNYFNGSEQEFKNYIGATVPQPAPTIVQVRQLKNTVLRDEPKGKITAVALLGTRYAVIAAQTDPDGTLWYDVGNAWILASHVMKVT